MDAVRGLQFHPVVYWWLNVENVPFYNARQRLVVLVCWCASSLSGCRVF
jgi:hypothetical protein